MSMHVRVAALATALALSSAAAPAASVKFQCWTDEHGQRACGDHVPAQYSANEREVFNGRGQVVETKPHAPTIGETEPSAMAPEGDAPKPASPAER